MLRLSNDNRYEGKWKEDKKHGEGKFYYLDKGQVLIGTWVENISKCGEMIDYHREGATNPTSYPLPELKLRDYKVVIAEARERFTGGNVGY